MEDNIWKRFPYLCSYCGSCPCECKNQKPETRPVLNIDNSKKPKNLSGFQRMFNEIYPANTRTLEHAGVHFAEEIGEFSEAMWAYRSDRLEKDFEKINLEAADYVSCLIGIFNSLEANLAVEISKFYPKNCHTCNNAPCTCSYEVIREYK